MTIVYEQCRQALSPPKPPRTLPPHRSPSPTRRVSHLFLSIAAPISSLVKQEEGVFGEAEPEESGSSPLTDRSLCVSVRVCLVCVCAHARIIAFREPLNALPLFLQVFRGLQYLLWALCPKGNILSGAHVTYYWKTCRCMWVPVHAQPHLKCEQASARSRGTFSFFFFSLVRHHLPKQCFILCREGGMARGGELLQGCAGMRVENCRAAHQPDQGLSAGGAGSGRGLARFPSQQELSCQPRCPAVELHSHWVEVRGQRQVTLLQLPLQPAPAQQPATKPKRSVFSTTVLQHTSCTVRFILGVS